MKTKTLMFSVMLLAASSCGDIKKAIADAEKTSTDTSTSTETANTTKEGSRTVTTSTTNTVKESGDQSVFKDTDTTPVETTKDVVVDVENPLIGIWFESCKYGLEYRKNYAPNGWLTITTYVYDNADCIGQPKVFVQKTKYKADESYVYYNGEDPHDISINGNGNTVVIGNSTLRKISH